MGEVRWGFDGDSVEIQWRLGSACFLAYQSSGLPVSLFLVSLSTCLLAYLPTCLLVYLFSFFGFVPLREIWGFIFFICENPLFRLFCVLLTALRKIYASMPVMRMPALRVL